MQIPKLPTVGAVSAWSNRGSLALVAVKAGHTEKVGR